ncbi:MAG: dihydroorotase [Myxococcota bacterium]|jgi:dihydroorotase
MTDATRTGRTVIVGGTVLDPSSGFHEPANVLIEGERTFGISREIPSDWRDATQVDAAGRLVIPGLICLRTQVCEPGYEWKEDVRSASRAAVAGGFTTICARPDTDPVNDVRAVTEQIVTRNLHATSARVLPVGAATIGIKGENLSEMGDMRDAGCVAVSTGETSIPSATMMRRVMEYARSVGLPVFSAGQDKSLTGKAVMNEGLMSLRLGMAASPAEAESIAMFRDGQLSRLTDWPIHFQRLSTRAGVEVLRLLRAQGIAATADCTPHHLWFDETAVAGFDTNTHVCPPLRTADDVEALREALREGLIDAVATDHAPESSIEKMVEYKWSRPGTTGLETALGAALDLVRRGSLDLMLAVTRMTLGPAGILGRTDLGRIGEGALADIAIVDTQTPWQVDARQLHTRGVNHIFAGQSLTGRVECTFVGGQIVYRGEEPEHAHR